MPGVSDLDRALDVLLDAQLAPIVDMVARRNGIKSFLPPVLTLKSITQYGLVV